MRGCGAACVFPILPTAGGCARNPERLPEPAGSGTFCHPPPQRPDRSIRPGAAAGADGFLVPLFLLPGGRGGAVRCDP